MCGCCKSREVTSKSQHHLSAEDLINLHILTKVVKIKMLKKQIKKCSNLREQARFLTATRASKINVSDAEAPPPPIPAVRRFTTKELFEGVREIAIEHNGEIYRLRITSRHKLILTK